jgi:tetratricopeptide (TPR) repeat protein
VRPARGARNTFTWAPAAAALVAFITFAPSFGHGFARDDHGLIVNHTALREGPVALARAMFADFHAPMGGNSGKWRPGITLSYAIEGAAGGWRPGFFHGMNALAHAAATALVALLIMQGGVAPRFALLAALWFAVMPVHVEPVSWIAGRTDLYATVFLLAALLADRARRGRGAWPGVPAVAAFGAGLACKEIGVAFALVLALDAALDRRIAGRAALARWLAPYAIVLGLHLVAWVAIGGVPERPAYLDPERAEALRRGVAWMLPAFLRFLLPGVTHAPDWPLPAAASIADPRVAGGLAFSAVMLIATAIGVKRRSRWATPLLIVVVPLLPPLATAWMLAAGGAVMAERLMYLPSVGVTWLLALALAAATAWLRARTRSASDAAAARAAGRVHAVLVGVPLLALVGAGAWTTVRDQSMYRGDAALYAALWERVPGHATGAIGLATVRMREGRIGEAVPLLDAAERIDPRIPEIHQARAEIAFATRAWRDVLAPAERTIALRPWSDYARALRAAARVRLGEDAPEIVALYGENPLDPLVASAYGEWLVAQGRAAEAVPALDLAMRAQGGDPWTALAFARALVAAGRRDGALAVLDHALRLQPEFREASALRAELTAGPPASGLAPAGDSAEQDAAEARGPSKSRVP